MLSQVNALSLDSLKTAAVAEAEAVQEARKQYQERLKKFQDELKKAQEGQIMLLQLAHHNRDYVDHFRIEGW